MTGKSRSTPRERPMSAPLPSPAPVKATDPLFDRLSHLLVSRFGLPAPDYRALMSRPLCIDLIDRNGELVLRAEVAGIAKKDLGISVHTSMVTIRGETCPGIGGEKGRFHKREIPHGAFQRCVPLPVDVDSDQARASFRDGILEIVMPKLHPSSVRQIRID